MWARGPEPGPEPGEGTVIVPRHVGTLKRDGCVDRPGAENGQGLSTFEQGHRRAIAGLTSSAARPIVSPIPPESC